MRHSAVLVFANKQDLVSSNPFATFEREHLVYLVLSRMLGTIMLLHISPCLYLNRPAVGAFGIGVRYAVEARDL